MDQEFPPNSKHNKKEKPDKQEKKELVQKVVSGEVVLKRKGFGHRMHGIFLGGDFNSAIRYIAAEVLLPAFRSMVVDAASKGVERMIYGDSISNHRSLYQQQGRPRMSYNSPVDRGPRTRALLPDQPRRGQVRRPGFDDIILASQEEAKMVVERLCDVIEDYEVVSVADLNEMIGLPSTFTDNQWGWGDARFISVRPVREGYLIDLPNVEPIN